MFFLANLVIGDYDKTSISAISNASFVWVSERPRTDTRTDETLESDCRASLEKTPKEKPSAEYLLIPS